MSTFLPVVLLLALAALFVFLAVRAARSRHWFVKWPGIVLSGLLALVFLAVSVVGVIGYYKLNNAPYQYTVSDVQVTADAEMLARGERIAYICTDCHASKPGELVLDGSAENMMSGPGAPPVGELWATNLTPGGPLKDWSDGEIIRAIREGVDQEGKPLMIMPSYAFRHMSDEDVQAVVAFLRTQPAVERDLPERNLNFLASLVIGSGMFDSAAQPPLTEPVVAPQRGTADYGYYLVTSAGCIDCHGDNLDGVGLYGPGVDLRPITPTWSEQDLITFFREAKDPKTGRAIDPLSMPISNYSKMFTDDDLKDLHKYLVGLPAAEASIEK